MKRLSLISQMNATVSSGTKLVCSFKTVISSNQRSFRLLKIFSAASCVKQFLSTSFFTTHWVSFLQYK